MQPAFFGHVYASEFEPSNYVTHCLAADGPAEPVLRFGGGGFYGADVDVGVATDKTNDLSVAVVGSPKWRSHATSLAAAAVDTMHAYRSDGVDVLSHLSNGFAIVIVDGANRTAHVAIDRIGRVPLAYAVLPSGGLCFSTDARAVARALSKAPKLNRQAIYNYTFFHQVPSPDTIFAGVRKLQPAMRLQWSPGRLETKLYWQPKFSERSTSSGADLKREFLTRLEDGVKAATPDDRTASFLSGGIDSSTVTGFLNRILGAGRPAYTIGFEQAGYDESGFARTVAKHFGADLRVHYISTDEVQRCIGDLALLYDEPFGNSSAVPALVCARIAKNDGITRMLAGDGGDELFAGNTRYAKQRIFEAFGSIPGFARATAEALFLSSSPLVTKTPLRKVGSYIRQAQVPLPDRLETYNFVVREKEQSIFAPEFLEGVVAQYPFALLRDQFWQLPNIATLDRMLYLDWKFTLADNDLRKVNATCRRAGVGVEFPWLDDGVGECSTRLPSTLKMRGAKLRYFVKQALADFLPHATIAKSKHGFGLPFGQWLKTSADLQAQVYGLLANLGQRGIFQPQFIDHLIAEHRSGHAAYFGTMVWVLAMLEAWLQANKSTLD